MSLFNKIFSSPEKKVENTPSSDNVSQSSSLIHFGRYSDCNKTKIQLDYWTKSLNSYKEKAYVDSFEHFLKYLRDDTISNVVVKRDNDTVEFEITQGSKVIRGKGDKDKFTAEALICKMEDNSIPVMRKLMSLNFALRYSKFALKDNVLCLKFSSHSIDASPNKLYDALKELCKKADQQDDLLTMEFSSLAEIDVESIIDLSDEKKNARYNYLIQLINDGKSEIEKHDAEKMGGGIAFVLLNLTYTIDYLICPHGQLTDALENIQRLFFAKNDMSTVERNRQIIEEYDKIINSPKEKVLEGLYDVKMTFAIAPAAAHKTVMDMMFGEIDKVKWYVDNNYPDIVEAIYGYMLSYAYFNYGMVYPMTEILNIGMNILNPEYYKNFGSDISLIDNNELNKKEITNLINDTIARAKVDYPNIGFNTASLNYTTKANFIDSMIRELDKMNLSK